MTDINDSSDITRTELLKLHRAVESSDEAIFITDLEGIITYVNPGFTELYGFTYEEVVGICTPRILKSGVMSPEDYEYFWKTMLSKKVIKGELVNKSKNGKLITVSGSANPILDEAGDIIGFIGVQHDITENKLIEEALGREQFLVNALLETLPDHIYFKDLESRFIRNSKSHALSFGFEDPAQLKGKTDFDFFNKEDAQKGYDDEQTIIKTGKSITTEERYTRNDKTDVWFTAIKLPLKDRNGKIIGTFGISRDITEQKKTEEQYSLLANALKGINECVSITDMNDKVLFLNRAFLDTYGFNEEDLKDESIRKIRSPNNPAELLAEILPATLNGGWFGELFNRKKDGTEFMVALSTGVVNDPDGKPVALIGVASDITERKKTEESLRQSEERFRSVTQSANDAIVSVDSKGKIFGWNRGAEIAFGFMENEILGKPLNIIIPEDYLNKHIKAMVRLELRGEKDEIGKTVELHGKKKNGDTFPLELSLSDWKTAEGVFFTGIVRDITKRKRTELENQIIYEITQGISTTSNIDELLKLIHHSLGKAVYAENFFVALNDEKTGLFSFPYFVDMIDTTPSPTSMGKSCSSYVFRTVKPFLFSDKEYKKLEELNEVELVGSASPSWVGIPLQTPSKVLGVMVLQHYKKENVFSEDDVKFLTSIGGQIAFAIERKLAESALQESERDLNDSQKIAGLGSYNLDFRSGRWTSSQILDSIFGIDEKYNRSVNGWADLIHPDWRDTMNKYLQEDVIEKKNVFNKEYKIIRKNDSVERWVHGRGELLYDNEGNLMYMIGNILDITQRKLAEEEINLKNELLQTLNSEKDKFFSILAHDLRGPLSAFVAATEIITDEIQTMSMEDIKDITLSMKKSATGIYSLLENLLEWSRLQRGVMDFIPEKMNLKKKIIDCTNVLSESARKKSIEVEISIDDSIEIVSDKHMFDTIIRNLISNAIKFTKTGGTISVLADRLGDGNVEVKVSDSGIGMSPELLGKLFHINEKSSRPGTEGEPSTGLGLLLCKEFVEKNGGVIKATSEINVGSTFTFTIPDINA